MVEAENWGAPPSVCIKAEIKYEPETPWFTACALNYYRRSGLAQHGSAGQTRHVPKSLPREQGAYLNYPSDTQADKPEGLSSGSTQTNTSALSQEVPKPMETRRPCLWAVPWSRQTIDTEASKFATGRKDGGDTTLCLKQVLVTQSGLPKNSGRLGRHPCLFQAQARRQFPPALRREDKMRATSFETSTDPLLKPCLMQLCSSQIPS